MPDENLNPDFTATLDKKIEEKAQTEGQPTDEQPSQPVPRGRGRPKGSKTQKSVDVAPQIQQKPIPPCNEAEAKAWAQMLAGFCSMFVKKEYRDKLTFTEDEFLALTRPGVVLKDFYCPSFGGIYTTWTMFAGAGIGLAFSKYKVIREIMDNEQGTKPPQSTNDGRQALRGDGRVATTEGSGNIVGIPTTRQDGSPVAGKENNTDNGNPGNGQEYKSQGTTDFTPPSFNL